MRRHTLLRRSSTGQRFLGDLPSLRPPCRALTLLSCLRHRVNSGTTIRPVWGPIPLLRRCEAKLRLHARCGPCDAMSYGAAGLDKQEVDARQTAVGMQTVSVNNACAGPWSQAVISGCVYLVGDLIAQSYEGLTEGFDKARAVRSGAACVETTLCNTSAGAQL